MRVKKQSDKWKKLSKFKNLNKIIIRKKTFSQYWIEEIKKVTDNIILENIPEWIKYYSWYWFKKYSITLPWKWSTDFDTKMEVFKYINSLVDSVKREIIIREYLWFDMKYDKTEKKYFEKYNFNSYKFRAWELFQF